MTRLAAIAVALVALPSVASAGAYVGLGIGTAPGGSWERTMGQADSGDVDGFERTGRLFGGARFSKLSVEGQANRFAMSFGDARGYRGTQLGVGLKLNIPLGNNFEVFGKGGLARTWLSSMDGPTDDWAGNGWFLGVGVEYRLPLKVTSASLVLDYQRSSSSFDSDGNPGIQFDSSLGMWMLGATVSF
jgi:hypothetical protein